MTLNKKTAPRQTREKLRLKKAELGVNLQTYAFEKDASGREAAV